MAHPASLVSLLDGPDPERPRIEEADASQAADTLFGLAGDARRVPSERDDTFVLRDRAGVACHVVKFSHTAEPEAALRFRLDALAAAGHGEGVVIPTVVPTRTGEPIGRIAGAGGVGRLVSVTTYLDGVPLGGDGAHGGSGTWRRARDRAAAAGAGPASGRGAAPPAGVGAGRPHATASARG